ncbi:MAG: DUF4286 family protein [Chitinophagaceae bacterium]|nr:MAG: DUF4286 family protein [Chitinophagaceae bacterium]
MPGFPGVEALMHNYWAFEPAIFPFLTAQLSMMKESDGKQGIIYNVTTKVAHAITEKWLSWMKEEYIPAMINTGCFDDALILRLVEVDETEGLTYAVQYSAANREDYNLFIENHSEKMSRIANAKWGSSIISFRSVLQVVN